MNNQGKEQGLYAARGVSATKAEVHAAITGQDKGLFPDAFCKILPDIAGDPGCCTVIHADGAGTKVLLAFLIKQAMQAGQIAPMTPNLWGFAGPAIDAAVMNLDDMGCVGATGPFWLSNAIGRNAKLISGEDIAEIIQGFNYLCERLEDEGIVCEMAGGETADIGDLVRTFTIDCTVATRMRRCDVIDCGKMRPGDRIVGFSSTGQARWEDAPNSGIGSNGLTSARHDLLCGQYKQLETFAPQIPPELVYRGEYKLEDLLPGDERFTIAAALSSPTRTYLPLIKRILKTFPEHIHGLIHCSGGGQTKIGKYGPLGLRFHKNNPFPVPPLFQILRKALGQTWQEMYQTYNMGWRLEAIVPADWVQACVDIAQCSDILAQEVGYVEEIASTEDNEYFREVLITAPDRELLAYRFKAE